MSFFLGCEPGGAQVQDHSAKQLRRSAPAIPARGGLFDIWLGDRQQGDNIHPTSDEQVVRPLSPEEPSGDRWLGRAPGDTQRRWFPPSCLTGAAGDAPLCCDPSLLSVGLQPFFIFKWLTRPLQKKGARLLPRQFWWCPQGQSSARLHGSGLSSATSGLCPGEVLDQRSPLRWKTNLACELR